MCMILQLSLMDYIASLLASCSLACQVPLDDSPVLQCIDCFPQVRIIHELGECVLSQLIHID